MRKNPSLEEIRELLERGELPDAPPGMTMADLFASVEAKFAFMLTYVMGIPASRVTIKILGDLGMPGKVAFDVKFDPELTEDERLRYEVAMRAVCHVMGSRPPIKIPEA